MSLTIKLARIDSRLLHGQVTTGWTNLVHPNRIFIVSDAVAKDTLRKNLLKQAAPAGVKVNIIDVDKMIKVWGDSRFDKLQLLLLTEDPETMLRLVEGGVEIPEINVGNMTFDEGDTTIASNLAVNDTDVNAFVALNKKGVHLSRQMVPADNAVDVMSLLKKADLI
ncbi:PTS system mannose/fructose/N-acetylgalactosamine-transporter subunit IIB [[Lactobacillus] timonensis]|jgi:mannose/fructose/sorbose-specific phosphotransferase system IIB component|uniref:PTS system mannose/fructose/N-acetylgalactosamine-transporter subunit IIB n=1 Tax=[Lactobacillus] timonensis TaxID=1970790 RepID=UPI000C83C814|nr:PTS sugar transporter subunit IIB [[Lactobacillus] timonensis]